MFTKYMQMVENHSLIEPDDIQDLDEINPAVLAKQKNDMIKKIFKQQTQPNEQQVLYAINVLNVKYGQKYGLKNVVEKLYLNFLEEQRRRILLDSHYKLQPNLYKLYEPDAGSNDMFYDGNKHYERLTLDHEVKRLISTREVIQKYCERNYSKEEFIEYIDPNKQWPQKLAKNKPAFFLSSAFRTVILQIQIFIALSLTIKITPMSRAEFDTIESKLLILDDSIPESFFDNFFRALKTTYGMKTKLLTQRQLILLYRQIRELVNVQKVLKDGKSKKTKHDQLYKRWTAEMNVSLMKFYIEQANVVSCTHKMQVRYSKIAHLIDAYLINLRMEILIRAAIKWIIIVVTQSRFQNPLQFRQQDRSIITRAPQLDFARYELIRLYSNRYFYEDQPIDEREFWKRELYEHAFKVIEVCEQGLLKYKKRKNRTSGDVFKDRPSDAEQLVKKKMKEAQFENYRQQVKQRYAIYKKQLERQYQAQTKMQLEKRILLPSNDQQDIEKQSK